MFTISEARRNQYSIIRHIAYTTWPVTYATILPKAQMEYMLDLFYSPDALNKNTIDGHHFLIAWENDVPLGFASYEHHYKSMNVTRIHKIYVLPEAQGKGIGKLLIGDVENKARENQSQVLSLNVNRQNNAQLFYAKSGFKNKGSEDVRLDHGYLMEDYIMEKIL